MGKLKTGFSILKDSFKEWREDRASRLAAAMAFYTLAALVPLVLILVSVAGLVYSTNAAQDQLVSQVRNVMGQQAAGAVGAVVSNAARPGGGVIGTIVGVLGIILGASGLFASLQGALNEIWEAKAEGGIWRTIWKRLVGFGMVLGLGLLFVILVASSTAAPAVARFSSALPFSAILFQVIDFLLLWGFLTLFSAAVFKFLPDAEISWSDTWVGAAVTGFLVALGTVGLGWYVGRSSVTSSYGAAGSFIALVFLIYYSAQIFFFGAEVTQVWARRFGEGLRRPGEVQKEDEQDRPPREEPQRRAA